MIEFSIRKVFKSNELDLLDENQALEVQIENDAVYKNLITFHVNGKAALQINSNTFLEIYRFIESVHEKNLFKL